MVPLKRECVRDGTYKFLHGYLTCRAYTFQKLQRVVCPSINDVHSDVRVWVVLT